MVDVSSLPLRRITRSHNIVTSHSVATRPRIGRVVSGSQMLANGLGRPATVRRHVTSSAAGADVKFPQWLLPAAAGRTDDLDPWRDRDLIAIRRARSRNRVVRQVPPRGLPMASHARGRSLLGDSTAPSSIARRLQPSRRPPQQNDAHLVTARLAPVRPATPRPPRARPLALPSGSSSDRDGPPAEPAPSRSASTNSGSTNSRTTNTGPANTGPAKTGRSIATPRSSTAGSTAPRSTTAASFSSASTDVRRHLTTRPPSSTGSPTSDSISRRSDAPSSDPPQDSLASAPSERQRSTNGPATEWTTFGASPSGDQVSLDPLSTSSRTRSLPSTSPSAGRRSGDDQTSTLQRSPSSAPSLSVEGSHESPASVAPNSLPAWTTPSWRRSLGLTEPEDTDPTDLTVSPPAGSTLAERVARLADDSPSPDLRRRSVPRAGDLVRRSPASSLVLSALSSTSPWSSESSDTRPERSKRNVQSNGSSTVARSRRPTATPRSTPDRRRGSPEGSPSDPSTAGRVGPNEVRRSVEHSTPLASPATTRSTTTFPATVTPSRVRPDSRTMAFGPATVALRRQHTFDAVRRSTGSRSPSPFRSTAETALPGGSGTSPFIGLLARSISRRQGGGWGTPTPSERRSTEQSAGTTGASTTRASTIGPRTTGAGPEAAAEFTRRLTAREGESRSSAEFRIPTSPIRSTVRRSIDQPPRNSDLSTSSPTSHQADTPASGWPNSTSPSLRPTDIAARVARAMGDTSPPDPIVTSQWLTSSMKHEPVLGGRNSNSPTDRRLEPTSAVRRSASPAGHQSSSSRNATRSSAARPIASGHSAATETSSHDTPVHRSSPRRFDPERASAIARRGRLRRSVSSPTRVARRATTDDAVLPVAPVVVTSGPSETTPFSATPMPSDEQSPEVTKPHELQRRSPVVIRRRTSSSPLARPDGSMSADDMARMLENGFEPTPSIRRTVSPVLALSRRRSGLSSSTSTVRRSASGLPVAPGPVEIVGQVSGESPAAGVTTSQLLDLMDWVNRIVDERLRNELERRGIAGGRW